MNRRSAIFLFGLTALSFPAPAPAGAGPASVTGSSDWECRVRQRAFPGITRETTLFRRIRAGQADYYDDTATLTGYARPVPGASSGATLHWHGSLDGRQTTFTEELRNDHQSRGTLTSDGDSGQSFTCSRHEDLPLLEILAHSEWYFTYYSVGITNEQWVVYDRGYIGMKFSANDKWGPLEKPEIRWLSPWRWEISLPYRGLNQRYEVEADPDDPRILTGTWRNGPGRARFTAVRLDSGDYLK